MNTKINGKHSLDVNGNIHYNNQENQIQTIQESSAVLKFRLAYYSVNFFILLWTGLILLGIDYGDDPLLLDQKYFRFRYLTIWNSDLHCLYIPLAIYCDWSYLKGKMPNEKVANFRHFFATGLMIVTTLLVDLIFWPMWWYDRELIVPTYCDAIISKTSQHTLHTLTMLTVLVDIFTVQRQKPKDLTWYNRALDLLLVSYASTVGFTFLESGKWIYPFLYDMKTSHIIALVIGLYYFAHALAALQWKIIDLWWGNTENNTKLKQ